MRSHMYTYARTHVVDVVVQDLMSEIQALEAGVRQHPGPHGLGIVLSLALNSLQRLHASQLHPSGSAGPGASPGNSSNDTAAQVGREHV
jgi:hypothetical protein